MARRKHKPRKKPQNIIGTEGNDNISTTFAKSVDGRGGDDTINSNIFLLYQNPNIFGGSGNDRMNVGKCFGVVDGGPGDDFMNITGGGPNGRVLGGDGNDTIHNGTGPNARGAEHSRFYGGKGDDFIENFGYKSMIYGEDGNDTIVNQRVFAYDPFATINGGSGDDLISLASGVKGNLIEYKAGDGNDTIQGFNANSTLKIGDGNDTYATLTANSDVLVFVGDSRIVLKDAASLSALNIQGTKSDALPSIKGTDDADTINNDWSYSTIEANAGDDSITNTGANTKINAGDGNDTISNSGADVTIDGGADADTITNSGANVSINGEAGNDEIRNEASQVTIDGGAGADRVTNRGASITIDGGDGNDSIYSYAASVSIVGGNGNDSIRNKGYNTTIDSGADNDRVANYSDNASIDLGDGNDSVENYGYNSTIDGGAGSDTIDNRGAKGTINAGAGDDVIKNNEHDVTIVSGAGNDNIFNHSAKGYGDRVLFQYNIGDGNDVITGFNETSTLQIGDGTNTYSTLTLDSDVIVFVGSSYVVLKDAASLSALNIQGSKVDGIPTIKGTDEFNLINNVIPNIIIAGGAGNDT
ncbi:MAG: hypothetical protein IJP68_05620, partial [Selenomonadaceae bacterium]|nr:hypothetical protein [Selenomonadaceae bacterium]